MSTVKHQEGEAHLTSDALTITFTRWTASPAKKQHSPLTIPLYDIVQIEQQLNRLNERYLRIVTPGYGAKRKIADDPHVLHFQPVSGKYAAEISVFVDAFENAVNALNGIPQGSRAGRLVQVDDIKRSPATWRTENERPLGPRPAASHHFPDSPRYRYNSPPNWPTPPPGWAPPADWRPDPVWGPPPAGWPFWVDATTGRPVSTVHHPHLPSSTHQSPSTDTAAPTPQQPSGPHLAHPQLTQPPVVAPPLAHARGPRPGHVDTDIGMFGARSKAKELAAEVNHLTEANARLNADLERLGVMETVQLEELKQQLKDDIEALRSEQAAQRDEAEIARKAATSQAAAEIGRLESHLSELRRHVVVTEDLLALQEAGVYEYSHPLDDSVAYRTELAKLKTRSSR